MYVKVCLSDAIYKIDIPYTYAVPKSLSEKAGVGKLCVVPFGGGNTARNAVIVELLSDEQSGETLDPKKIKPIFDIPDTDFFLSDEQLALCRYMKEICFCTFGEALRCVKPSGISVRVTEYYEPSPGLSFSDKLFQKLNVSAYDLLTYTAVHEKTTLRELCDTFGKNAKAGVSALIKGGYLVKRTDCSFRENQKNSRSVRLLLSRDDLIEIVEEGSRLYTEKQRAMLRTLYEYGGTLPLRELCALADAGEGVAKEICKKGGAEFTSVREERAPYRVEDIPPSEDFALCGEQIEAYDTLCALYDTKKPRAALLCGVTGSGKTNVILKTIDRVIADGRQVIYLVPEIALTSQTVGIFVGRYRDRIAVLHSALSVGEKTDAWRKIESGEADIVVGTRSAVFAPTKKLGMIVIDEEQESSFKSDMSPKYHARDIARFRCATSNALMLLASATPSVESFYKAKSGIYTLISMKNRYGNAKLPQVVLYDMKPERSVAGTASAGVVPSMIGKVLEEELSKNLRAGEQSILFINRRGYHSLLTCRGCGYVMQCPHCSVAMTYHKYGGRYRAGDKMICHYCGYSAPVPKACPNCKSEHMIFLGNGTQTLEEELSARFPDAKLLRMDADTTGAKSAYEEILTSFRKNEADILVGTQMVTKGHDFPNVTLVGVVLADASLYLCDYRANERTFSLITQVLGRAGRSEKAGRAVIQTYSPEHPLLLQAARQDYESFFDEEIKLRRAAIFPPFCELAAFLFSGENETRVRNVAEEFGKKLDLLAKSRYAGIRLIVFGPFEAAVYKLGGKFRLRYIIKCKNDKTTREFLKELLADFSVDNNEVSISLDINPSAL